jgi:protein-tyrosine phosphatase
MGRGAAPVTGAGLALWYASNRWHKWGDALPPQSDFRATSIQNTRGYIRSVPLGPNIVLIRLARRAYHAIRHLPERLLHPFRHGAAVERCTKAGPPERVLILCYGNICRSPYAEGQLRRMLGDSLPGTIRVESAGFFGPGRPANDVARRAAHSRGVNLSSHRSRVADSTFVTRATLVVVMTGKQALASRQDLGVPRSHILILGDLDPEAMGERDIPDPYGQSEEVFERVFDRIDRCLATLVQTWN